MIRYSQWHYILGYGVILVSHNWPIMLCVLLGGISAIRLYRHARPRDVRWLFGWTLLGFTYEYHKHLRGILDEAIDFLLIQELRSGNAVGHIATLLPLPFTLALALWMFWSGLCCGATATARRADDSIRP